MKRFFLFILAVFMMSPAFAQIKVDGDFSDWDYIPTEYLASVSLDDSVPYRDLYTMKWCVDSLNVAFFFEFNNDTVYYKDLNGNPKTTFVVEDFVFRISTDGDSLTGLFDYNFGHDAADYTFEGDRLSDFLYSLMCYQAYPQQDIAGWTLTGPRGLATISDIVVLPDGHGALEGTLARDLFTPIPFREFRVGVFTGYITNDYFVTGMLPQGNSRNEWGYYNDKKYLNVPIYDGYFDFGDEENAENDNEAPGILKGVETISNPKSLEQPVKIWKNGKMYILLPNGQVFDSTGKRVE